MKRLRGEGVKWGGSIPISLPHQYISYVFLFHYFDALQTSKRRKRDRGAYQGYLELQLNYQHNSDGLSPFPRLALCSGKNHTQLLGCRDARMWCLLSKSKVLGVRYCIRHRPDGGWYDRGRRGCVAWRVGCGFGRERRG
jgi:hypothetical protein